MLEITVQLRRSAFKLRLPLKLIELVFHPLEPNVNRYVFAHSTICKIPNMPYRRKVALLDKFASRVRHRRADTRGRSLREGRKRKIIRRNNNASVIIISINPVTRTPAAGNSGFSPLSAPSCTIHRERIT